MMTICPLTDSQIQFNLLKHHRGYILGYLENDPAEDLLSGLEALCNNNVDIYTGRLTAEEICRLVAGRLNDLGIMSREAYLRWLQGVPNYRLVKLTDGSVWVLLKGNDESRYIHIHPAKTGAHTIRFKGSTLKTVYQLKLSYPELRTAPTLVMVNQARKEAGFSPVKKLEPLKGILKCWDVMH